MRAGYLYYGWVLIGVLLGIVSLTVNQLFPTIIPGSSSFISPTGGKFYIFGIHLKHWIYGSILLIIGIWQIFYVKNNHMNSRIYSFLLGLGLLLTLDELDDIYYFITTGNLG